MKKYSAPEMKALAFEVEESINAPFSGVDTPLNNDADGGSWHW